MYSSNTVQTDTTNYIHIVDNTTPFMCRYNTVKTKGNREKAAIMNNNKQWRMRTTKYRYEYESYNQRNHTKNISKINKKTTQKQK